MSTSTPAHAVWTQEQATAFIEDILQYLVALGFERPQVIGGVCRLGYSLNDLDLLLKPSNVMTLGDAIGLIEDDLLPRISDDRVVNPLECGDRDDVWFLNIELRADAKGVKRVVEFYMEEDDFPLELNEPRLPGPAQAT